MELEAHGVRDIELGKSCPAHAGSGVDAVLASLLASARAGGHLVSMQSTEGLVSRTIYDTSGQTKTRLLHRRSVLDTFWRSDNVNACGETSYS